MLAPCQVGPLNKDLMKRYVKEHSMKFKKPSGPVVLCILDGFGEAPAGDANAISLAATPNYDRLVAENLARGGSERENSLSEARRFISELVLASGPEVQYAVA